jgi:hypothetical protein
VIILALLVVRSENKKKLLNCLADIERHAKLKIKGQPRLLSSEDSDMVVSKIMKEKPKFKSKQSVMVKVEEDTTRSILSIRKIHPPGHLVVVSEEYPIYKKLIADFEKLTPMKGYYSHKN